MKAARPPFDAEYALMKACPTSGGSVPADESKLMIVPDCCAVKAGSNDLVKRKGARRFTAIVLSHVATLVSSTDSTGQTIALLTRISTHPNASKTRLTAASTLLSSARSVFINNPLLPRLSVAFKVSFSTSEMSRTAISAPR